MEEPETLDDERHVPIEEHLKSELERIQGRLDELNEEMGRLRLSSITAQEKVERVIEAETPKEAAQILVDAYLNRHGGIDRDKVFDYIADVAGEKLRKAVSVDVDPTVLLGVVLERAGVGLAGDDGVVGRITKAASRMARNMEFIKELVQREIGIRIRPAIKNAIDDATLDQAAREIAQELKDKVPFDSMEALRAYSEDWKKEHAWCDMGEAVRMAVYSALVDIGALNGKPRQSVEVLNQIG